MATFPALPAQQIRMPNFAQALQAAQAVRGAQQQSEFQRMQMDAYDRQADRDLKAQSLAPKALGGDRAAEAELVALDPARAKGIQEHQAGALDLQKGKQAFKLVSMARIVGQAQSPEDVRAGALRLGFDASMADKAAASFAADPEGYRKDANMSALTIQQQMTQQNADRNHGLEEGRFAETQRHNRQTESTASGRLALDRDKAAADAGRNTVVENIEAKSAFYQRALGVDAATANKIASGVYKVSRNPDTGQAEIMDLSTGAIVNVQQSAPQGDPGPLPAAPGAEPGRIDLSDAYGAKASLRELWGDTAGQVDPSQVDTDVVEARTAARLAQGSFMLALKKNDRLPVFEQQRLADMFEAPSAWKSAGSAATQIRTIKGQVAEYRQHKQAVADDPSAHRDHRKKAREALRAYDELDQALGQFDTGAEGEGATATNPETGERAVFRNGQWERAE